MTRSKRRINSTGRRRIPKGKVEIRIADPEPGANLTATLELEIGDLRFPETAVVVLEAYQRSTSKRFECGTVGSLKIPRPLDLSGLDQTRGVLFRLRIIDNRDSPGRVIGAAERISPRSGDETEGRRSIFPIVQRDLGSEIWRVQIENDVRPTLVLNNRIPAFQHRLLDNPFLQGVLLPAALRTVARYLAGNEFAVDIDEGGWQVEWFEFLREELEIRHEPPTGEDGERDEWVDSVVQAFCERQDFVSRIRLAVESGDGQ
jgi:hypothetical protein